jgi:acetyl esterase/lipase
MAVCAWFALRPVMPDRSSPRNVSFWLGFLVNELPFVAGFVLAASTLLAAAQGDLATPLGLVGAGLAAASVLVLAAIARRALRAREVVDAAVAEAVGTAAAPAARRRPWARILLWPFPFFRWDVKRTRNITYGEAGRFHRLDLYRPRGQAPDGPTFVHFHGGAFRAGGKSREARPLLHRLASHGWVCVSANYRLTPHATFPDQLVDAKRVIAWVREGGHRYGADGELVFVSGSSAGGHLASVAALTSSDPAFQPGFEGADTSVTAAIPLYGYFGGIDTRGPRSSPHDYVHEQAPPFFVVHGANDTLVIVEDARTFVDHLRETSSNPVAYAELPAAQHDFDLVHSIRFEAVVDGIERFAAGMM